MERLLIIRTNPVQTKPVIARFTDAETNQEFGTLAVPFPLWLQFEKLIKEGLDWRKRQDPQNVRIAVTFEATEVREARERNEKVQELARKRGLDEIDDELRRELEAEIEPEAAPETKTETPEERLARSLGRNA